jgi:hypothetical protein
MTAKTSVLPSDSATEIPKQPETDAERHGSGKGMKAETLDLYEGPPRCQCCVNWVEEYPKDVKESIEAAEGAQQYALLLRYKRTHKEFNMEPLELDSVVIHSPIIKAVLKDVLAGYQGITLQLENLNFTAPFAPFFHRWRELEHAAKSQTEELGQKHMKLL